MDDMANEKREWLDDTALGLVERMANAWCKSGLPVQALARAMLAAGTSIIETNEGRDEAAAVVGELQAQLEENRESKPKHS